MQTKSKRRYDVFHVPSGGGSSRHPPAASTPRTLPAGVGPHSRPAGAAAGLRAAVRPPRRRAAGSGGRSGPSGHRPLGRPARPGRAGGGGRRAAGHAARTVGGAGDLPQARPPANSCRHVSSARVELDPAARNRCGRSTSANRRRMSPRSQWSRPAARGAVRWRSASSTDVAAGSAPRSTGRSRTGSAVVRRRRGQRCPGAP